MDIFVAAQLATMTPDDTQQTRSQIRAAVDNDAQTLVVSEKFYKITLPTNRLASPIQASSSGPVVADVNKNQLGKLKDFIPKVIVISGQKTFRKAHLLQTPRIEVWMGERAIKAMGLDLAQLQSNCVQVAKDGEISHMSASYRAYKRSVKRGYVPKVEAVSPPGWEDSVKKMKDNHPEIDNPWALAWWMSEQGYEPRSGE